MIGGASLSADPRISWPTLLLAALVFLAPLPLGSARPLPEAILESGAFLLLAVCLLFPGAPNRSAPAAAGVWLPSLALVGIAVLGLVQAAPLPPSVVRALSPASDAIQQRASDVLLAAGDAATARTLSVSAAASIDSALLWAAIGALLSASLFLCREPGTAQRQNLGAAVLAAALFQVLYGVANLGTGRIWGFEVAPEHAARLRGTFANADHAALFLEMALALALAWAWFSARRSRRLRDMSLRILAIAPPVVVWLVLFIGLVFTGSRAGLAAAALAAMAQFAVLSAVERTWRPVAWGGLLLALGGAVLGIVGFQQGLERLLGTPAHAATWAYRLTAYRSSFELWWTQFTWLGTGLGTFRDAFPLVQPSELSKVWTHAHNDVLELLLTTGVTGLAIFLVGLGALIRVTVRQLQPERERFSQAHALAIVGALVSVGLHSFVDFGLTTPANAVTLAVLCGTILGAGSISTVSTGRGLEPQGFLENRGTTSC